MSDYDYEHQKRREELLPKAWNTPCPMCNKLMVRGQELDLDHTVAKVIDRRSRGDRIVHASCNRKAGQKLGQKRSRFRPSREW